MSFKEFLAWCNERACDGCWGLIEAMICIDVITEVGKKPFWKREKFWRETYMTEVIREIVNPTNQKIGELLGEE